jgi:hypothetical protein
MRWKGRQAEYRLALILKSFILIIYLVVYLARLQF